MSSSRLTRMQVHERFKQNFNARCGRQVVAADELLDDSLTNLQWLQNLNVNIVNPINAIGIPSISVGSTAGTRRVNVGSYRRNKNTKDVESHMKPRAGDVAHLNGFNSPVKGDPGNLTEGHAPKNLHSRLLSDKEKHSKGRNPRKNPLPPLIQQSRTPLPNQYRSRVGGLSKDSQANSLPRLSGSNESLKLNTRLCENATILTASPEFALLSDASSQLDRDLLPGQVDYKNNPYVKPPFSHFALICMALRRNRDRPMNISKICDWIKNNFIYYRCVGSDWQTSIRDNLARHKCFQRVPRGQEGSGKGVSWRIDPKFEDKFSDGMLRKRRLASAGEEKGQSSSSSEKSSSRGGSPSMNQNALLSDYDFLTPEDFVDDPQNDLTLSDNDKTSENSSAKGSAGHKRKQATPQKLARSKKSKKQQNKINLLEDQAPELGSLKGDFTWNAILEDIHLDGSHAGSSVNSSLSLTSTPFLGRRKTGGTPVANSLNLSNEGLFSDVLPPTEMDASLLSINGNVRHGANSPLNRSRGNRLISPPNLQLSAGSPVHWVKMEKTEIDPLEDFFVTEKPKRGSQEGLGTRRSGNSLHTPTFPDLDFDPTVDLDGFLKDVEALDLTVTGKQIEPPEDWVPVNISLESILCESQDLNLGRSDHQNLGGLSEPPTLTDANDENSPRSQSKRPGRRRPGSSSSGTGSTNTSPRRVTVVTSSNILPRCGPRQPRSNTHPWQELKTATDTIESLLGTSFDNVA